MTGKRQYVMAVSVFALALGIGFVMQHDGAIGPFGKSRGQVSSAASLVSFAPAQASPGPLEASATEGQAVTDTITVSSPALPDDPPVEALPIPDALMQANRVPDSTPGDGIDDHTGLSPFGLPCAVSLDATAAPGGMVLLDLDAPCFAGAPVSIRQGAMRITETTDTTGHLEMRIPALTVSPKLTLRFDDGTTVETEASVPEAAIFDRVVLQWQGRTGLSLQAFEYGAGFGDEGHVHAGAAHSPDRSVNRGAGFLTALGASDVPGAWMAEIYSFPVREARREGLVDIQIEAAITTSTCGREIRAETIQPHVSGPGEAVDLTIGMPDCSAIGDFLVLKNLMQDMRVAAR